MPNAVLRKDKEGSEIRGAVVTAVTGGEGEEVVVGFFLFETRVLMFYIT